MKIMIVTRDVDYGIGTTVKNLVWEFEKREGINKITVVAPRKFHVETDKTDFLIVKTLGKYFFSKEPYFAYKAYRKIKKHLETNSYDVINNHFNIWKYNFNKNKANTPKLVNTFQVAHKSLSTIRTFHFSHEQTSLLQNVGSLKYRYGRWLHTLFIKFDKRAVQEADVVTCVSVDTQNVLTKYSDSKSHIHFIPNGVDVEKYYPTEVNGVEYMLDKYDVDVENKFVLLYIGRLDSAKGLPMLANAIKGMDNVVLVVVGDGAEKRWLSAQKNIHTIGYVSDYKVKNALLNMCDLFVYPSLYENFPLSIAEAMATSKAVLATNVGMIPYMLENRKHPLVEPGNTKQLKDMITLFSADRALLKKEGELNLDFVKRNLDWSMVADAYLKLYKTR